MCLVVKPNSSSAESSQSARAGISLLIVSDDMDIAIGLGHRGTECRLEGQDRLDLSLVRKSGASGPLPDRDGTRARQGCVCGYDLPERYFRHVPRDAGPPLPLTSATSS